MAEDSADARSASHASRAADSWLTIPNCITVLRLFLVVPIAFILISGTQPILGAVLVAIFGATDWVDGFIARRTGTVSRVGEILDPIADRVGLIVIVLVLVLVQAVPLWIVVTVVVVDIVVVVLSAVRDGRSKLSVTMIGKIRTAVLMTGIAATVLGLIPGIAWALTLGNILLTIGAVLHVLAALSYLRQLR
ncbi:CDP-alcohol phosphatidyltransferase family protein [Humidisolicoccus flavus]|uniref:CDP-alcohol phosphatidyltransferase family protein n=1 Tax=Humidisolicoccus flavus TaxID=3111414 RepID=UPI0032491BAB